jgi:hypothetical protein
MIPMIQDVPGQTLRPRGERWNLPGIAKGRECFRRDGLESFSAFALIHLGSSLRDPMLFFDLN